jgi:hypothetical protein
LTREGRITEGLTAGTGLEYHLIQAVERLEDYYREREKAIHRRLSNLSEQVNALAAQVETLTSLL